jgi:O-antigen ligase
MKKIIDIRNNRLLIFIWWLNIFAQSVIELGIVYALIFILTTFGILFNNYKDSIALVAISFFIPFTSSILVSPFAILMLLSFLFYLIKIEFHMKIILNVQTCTVYLFLLFCTFSSLLFFNGEINNSIKVYLLSLFFFFIFTQIFSTIKNKQEFHEFLKKICLYSSLTIFISLTHFYLWDDTNLSQLISSDDISGVFSGKQYLDSSLEVKRFIWAGIDPNFFASSFLFMWFISFYFAKREKLYLIASLLIILSIIGTFSRTAFIVFSLSVLPLIFQSKSKFKLIIIYSAIISSIILYSPEYVERIYSITDNIKQSGGTGRFELLYSGLSVWGDNIMGVGLGNLATGNFGSSVYVSNFSSHNTYLEILIESGLIGLILFIIVLYNYLLQNKKNDELGKLLTIGLFGTLIFYFTIPVSDFRYLFLIILVLDTHKRLYLNEARSLKYE